MPVSDVNQTAVSLTNLQIKDVTGLTLNSPQQISTFGRQTKNSTMASSTSVVGKQGNQNAAALSADEAIVNLLERTKYTIVQENGQRRYGPPPDWKCEPPPRGCEVFIGKIPRDCFEDELIPIFEQIGPIYVFRLMMEFTGINRGYGFCVYTTRDDAKRAVEKLNNYEIRKGKTIGVCVSVDNCRLFVGGIPKDKNREEILAEMERVTEGVKDVISYPSVTDKTKNRGFAFVEYMSHKAAAMARRKLMPGSIQFWGQKIAVDWAEPEREVNEDIMSKVKILYVRNLMLSTTEETLRELFTKAAGGDPNCVERVKKISDYAFIHFKEREQALQSLLTLNDTFIDGSKIEVTWAKPVDKTESAARQSTTRTSGKLLDDFILGKDVNTATAVATVGGLLSQIEAASQYYIPSTGQAGPVANELLSINSTAVAPVGSDLNMASPGGLRLYGTRTGRRNAAGSRSAGAQRDRKHPVEKLQQHQVNPLLSFETLENLCRNHGFGSPVYATVAADFIDPTVGNKIQLHIGQVYIPNLRLQFQTPRCYSTPSEAKLGAGEIAIENLLFNILSPHEGQPQNNLLNVPFTDCNGIFYNQNTFNNSKPETNNSCLSNDCDCHNYVNNAQLSQNLNNIIPSNNNDSNTSSSTPVPTSFSTSNNNNNNSINVCCDVYTINYLNSSEGTSVSHINMNPTITSSTNSATTNLINNNGNISNCHSVDYLVSNPKLPLQSRSCSLACNPSNSLVTFQHLNIPSTIPRLIYQTQCPNLINQPNLSRNDPNYQFIPSLTNLKPYTNQNLYYSSNQSTGLTTCPALTGNYAFTINPGIIPSGTAFVPMQLSNNVPNPTTTLGIIPQQSGTLHLSGNSNLSTNSNGPTTNCLNNMAQPVECSPNLIHNGFDYTSQLITAASLGAPNLIGTFNNPQTYYFDPNTMSAAAAAAMMVGSNGLTALPQMIGLQQADANCTPNLLSNQSLSLNSANVPMTGLCTLDLPFPVISTPSQHTPTSTSQAPVMNLINQAQPLGPALNGSIPTTQSVSG